MLSMREEGSVEVSYQKVLAGNLISSVLMIQWMFYLFSLAGRERWQLWGSLCGTAKEQEGDGCSDFSFSNRLKFCKNRMKKNTSMKIPSQALFFAALPQGLSLWVNGSRISWYLALLGSGEGEATSAGRARFCMAPLPASQSLCASISPVSSSYSKCFRCLILPLSSGCTDILSTSCRWSVCQKLKTLKVYFLWLPSVSFFIKYA